MKLHKQNLKARIRKPAQILMKQMDDVDVFSDSAGEAAAAQNGFGTANTVFAKGTYKVSVTLKKANDLNTDSMAASCIAGMQLLR